MKKTVFMVLAISIVFLFSACNCSNSDVPVSETSTTQPPPTYLDFGDSLIYVNVTTDNIATEKGLKVGDAESMIKQLHGEPTKYIQGDDNNSWYKYITGECDAGDLVLYITVHDGKVSRWQFGRAQYIKYRE